MHSLLDPGNARCALRTVGYLCFFSNPSLGLNFTGSMQQYLEQERSAGRNARIKLDDPRTRRTMRPVKVGPLAIVGIPLAGQRTGNEDQLVKLTEAEKVDTFRDFLSTHPELWQEKARSNRYWVPYFLSAWLNATELLQRMLDDGIPVDITGHFSMTALHWAATSGAADAVELLARHGADISLANEFSWTAVDLASNNAHAQVEQILMNKGGRPRGWATSQMMASLLPK